MRATTYFTDNGTVNQLCAIVLTDDKGNRVRRTIKTGSIKCMLEVLARMGDKITAITYGGARCPISDLV